MAKAARILTAMLALAATAAAPAAAVPAMTVLSSATYDSGTLTDAIYASTTDASGNLYVAGASGNDWLSMKFTRALVPDLVNAKTYSNGRSGNIPAAIALDSQGNIIVAGIEANASAGQDYLVVKYSAGFAAQLASATYDGGSIDKAVAVVVDPQDNVYVTGSSMDGTNDNFYTIKYDATLTKVSTKAYDNGYAEQPAAMALDGDYLIIAGRTNETDSSNDIIITRYDTSLNLAGRTIFQNTGSDMAAGVAVDPSGNIIVAGRRVAATADFLVLKYDNLLNLISSATYDSGLADQATGLAVDSAGNIIVTGYSGPGGARDFLTVKFDNNLNLISTATYNGGLADQANTVAVDREDNVFASGQSETASVNFFAIKYNASPKLTDVSPIYIGETSNVTFKGYGLIAGSSVAFTDPAISTGAINTLSGQITLSVTPAASVLLGATTVTITAPNGESVSDYSLPRTYLRTTVAAGSSAAISAMTRAGQAAVTIPSSTFPGQQVIITLYTVAADASGRQIGESLYISASPAATPQQNVAVTMHYLDSDLGSNTESSLKLGYYDSSATSWATLNTSLNTTANSVAGVTRTLNTRYSVVNPGTGGGGGGTVPGGMGGATVYPSPYRPGSGGDFDSPTMGDGIVFAGLGANQAIKITIVDLAGQLVYQKSATANSEGKWLWDTKTATGGQAATGVYIYMLKGAGNPVTGKLSIIR